jgi:hypothetical protein
MARYYKRIYIAGSPNTETLQAALTSTPEEPKRVVEVWCIEAATTKQNDALIRIYVERERVAELCIRQFTDMSSAPTYPQGHGVIPLDITLDVGETLYIGHYSYSTGSNIDYVVVYEIVGT